MGYCRGLRTEWSWGLLERGIQWAEVAERRGRGSGRQRDRAGLSVGGAVPMTTIATGPPLHPPPSPHLPISPRLCVPPSLPSVLRGHFLFFVCCLNTAACLLLLGWAPHLESFSCCLNSAACLIPLGRVGAPGMTELALLTRYPPHSLMGAPAPESGVGAWAAARVLQMRRPAQPQ